MIQKVYGGKKINGVVGCGAVFSVGGFFARKSSINSLDCVDDDDLILGFEFNKHFSVMYSIYYCCCCRARVE